MHSISLLINALKRDFPAFTFTKGDSFHWAPKERTVYYANTSDAATLLHEVAHAVLGHDDYRYDIELLKMERAAWDQAITLSGKYGAIISQEQVETMLDSYRDWLHGRSLCPTCHATGIQTEAKLYSCVACRGTWRVNEARSCALRRYQVSTAPK